MYGVDFNFKYPFLYLFTFLSAGILCRDFLTIPFYLFCILLLLVSICLFIRIKAICIDLLLLASVFCCGICSSSPSTPENIPENIYHIHGRCEEQLTYNHYILSVRKEKFYLTGNDTNCIYSPGDSLDFYAHISPLRANANPGEFNNKKYMLPKNTFYALVPVSEIQRTGQSSGLRFIFHRFRNRLSEKICHLIKDSTCQALTNALCLGLKNELGKESRQLFTQTGTIHLLSVSGLHTGAVYLFFLFCLKSIGLSDKSRRLTALPLLWAYALLTGLSPSVTRAATILSFIATGKTFHRTYIPLNAVAASAFITLLISPTLIYSISFQLSYSAYTGIIILYPRLSACLKLPPVLSELYACFCASISAQFLTLPLCAYYFHMIPVNSCLINLAAIPLATLLLYTAMGCLVLPVFISQYLAFVPEITGKTLIRLLQVCEPVSINIKDLYPSGFMTVLIYVILISICLFLLTKEKRWLSTASLLLLSATCWCIFSNIENANRQEIIIFQSYKSSAILLNHQGNYISLYHHLADYSVIKPYIVQNKLSPVSSGYDFLSPSLSWISSCLFAPQDTVGIIHPGHSSFPACNILIITENVTPEQLFSASSLYFPQQVICDGSNHPSICRLWEQFCQQQHIVFRATSTEGYIRLSLK